MSAGERLSAPFPSVVLGSRLYVDAEAVCQWVQWYAEGYAALRALAHEEGTDPDLVERCAGAWFAADAIHAHLTAESLGSLGEHVDG